ncbi:hypothetical protein H4Q26_007391 [Puccinia striiformis f. sp. tritici PST-130]|nr:hypothetical protein H4Q26_007391 [Puccinia striiformis f. sp. tritici PST-130]
MGSGGREASRGTSENKRNQDASLISEHGLGKTRIAAQHPRRYKLDKDELERVSKLAGDRLTHVKELLDEHTGGAVEDEEPVDVEDMIAGSEDDEKEHKDSDENEWSDEEEGEEDGQNNGNRQRYRSSN